MGRPEGLSVGWLSVGWLSVGWLSVGWLSVLVWCEGRRSPTSIAHSRVTITHVLNHASDDDEKCAPSRLTCEQVDDLEALLEVRNDGVGGHVAPVGVVVVAVVAG